ncbi:two pore domain potassium channel family protein [Oceanobacillus piezotolerans]|uniref:Two pore domain potassium channel family protein n=1 Tax=Oceanobacillus piezotolerans TaxID=2448030 RepID=A0A498D5U0_9BACI|nr:potassium channel family protein [Oceanobacillus piezotolerans]RLL40336.1 two pore domain potassium channel family protein [Oceanobacillus piezotolerans]
MTFIPWLVFIVICIVLLISITEFIRGKRVYVKFELRDSKFSRELFLALILIYLIVIIGFGLVYFILSLQGIVLVENGELRQVSVIGSMIHSLYFSGVTLLTIGYGDITPLGIGRFIALLQALIGYVLPTAFVMKLFESRERSRDK